MAQKKCLACGKLMHGRPFRIAARKYCSNKCQWIYSKKKPEQYFCKNCGIEFWAILHTGKHERRFCSLSCAYIGVKGEKKPKSIETARIKREKRNLLIDQKYGKLVRDLLNSGAGLNELIKAMGKGPIPISNYLIWAGLKDQQLANSAKIVRAIALRNSKLGAAASKRIAQEPPSQEMCDWFKEQKKAGKFKGQVCRAMKEKYNSLSKYNKLCKLFGSPGRNPQSGCLNPMYGKTPSKKAGIGCKGWLLLNGQSVFFRSSLEMRIFLYLHEQNKPVILSTHRIKYKKGDLDRTYCPDLVIGTTIYEIKPSAMLKLDSVKKKWKALKKYVKQNNLSCEFITEKTYPLQKLTQEYVDSLISTGTLKMINNEHYEKLLRQL